MHIHAMDCPDGVIALAEEQHGLFSRRQVVPLGVDSQLIRTLIRRGLWEPLSSQVIGVRGTPFSWKRRALAAVLHHPEALVTGRAAAALHQLDGFRPGAIEVIAPLTGNARSPLATVHRSMYFSVLGRAVIDCVPVVTVEEALVSVMGSMPERELSRVIDTALTQGRVTVEALADVHGRQAGDRTRGMHRLADVINERLPDAPTPSASEMDRLLDLLLDDPGIPPAIRESKVPWNDPKAGARVDREIRAWGLLVEGDGRTWHTRVQDFERDRLRDNLALAAGKPVLRFTYRMLRDDLEGCRLVLLEVGRRMSGPAPNDS